MRTMSAGSVNWPPTVAVRCEHTCDAGAASRTGLLLARTESPGWYWRGPSFRLQPRPSDTQRISGIESRETARCFDHTSHHRFQEPIPRDSGSQYRLRDGQHPGSRSMSPNTKAHAQHRGTSSSGTQRSPRAGTRRDWPPGVTFVVIWLINTTARSCLAASRISCWAMPFRMRVRWDMSPKS